MSDDQTIAEIHKALVEVARSVGTLSQDRESLLEVKFLTKRIEDDVKRMVLMLEGTNGIGLKGRFTQLEEKVKTLVETGMDQKTLRRMWLGMALSILAGVTGLLISLLLKR